jgi:hypothetical protein
MCGTATAFTPKDERSTRASDALVVSYQKR